MPHPLLETRRTFASTRLKDLRAAISEIKELNSLGDLCIYVTGSYGRLEASEYSDLDLFFIHKGSSTGDPVSKIDKILADARLIETCRAKGFPEFSGDGEYLEIHHLDDIKKELGSPNDDALNYFTARLLLILESRPVWNDELYDEILNDVIGSYFVDFNDHEATFRPIFLINDILRFWKTLCLNYEHKRHRSRMNDAKKVESHLKNLKLKFSRMLTCFSGVIPLSVARSTTLPDDVRELIQMEPMARLSQAAQKVSAAPILLDGISSDYSWFLEKTGRPKEEVLAWISDVKERRAAFERARSFGDKIFALLSRAAEGTDTMRYLVI